MRIIAGDFKGRSIQAVTGKKTRPTSDKIKESVFQMIGPYFNGGLCLDLFAGSGSLGIESISRGMTKVIFIDNSSQAIKVITKNIDQLRLHKQSEVYRNDAFRALQVLKKRGLVFDLILIDPPYGALNDLELLTYIMDNNLLNDMGIIYYEHGANQALDFEHENLITLKQIKYGTTTAVSIFQKR